MLFKSNIYIDIYKYIYFGLAQSYFIYIAYIYIYTCKCILPFSATGFGGGRPKGHNRDL